MNAYWYTQDGKRRLYQIPKRIARLFNVPFEDLLDQIYQVEEVRGLHFERNMRRGEIADWKALKIYDYLCEYHLELARTIAMELGADPDMFPQPEVKPQIPEELAGILTEILKRLNFGDENGAFDISIAPPIFDGDVSDGKAANDAKPPGHEEEADITLTIRVLIRKR